MPFRVPVVNPAIPFKEDKAERELFHNTAGQVAQLHSIGYTVEDIAEKTGLTIPQVKNRLKPIKKRWEAEALKSLEEQVGREVEAANYLMKTAMETYIITGGNPAFLLAALRAAKLRSDVLALSKRMGDKKNSGGSSIQDLLELVQGSDTNDISSSWEDDADK